MFEIREFFNDNHQVIRIDVGDLLKEMEAKMARKGGRSLSDKYIKK